MKSVKCLAYLIILSVTGSWLAPNRLMGAANKAAGQRLPGVLDGYPQPDVNGDGGLSGKASPVSRRGTKQKKARARNKQLPKVVNAEGVPAAL